jgi:epoxyqueuosine reductase
MPLLETQIKQIANALGFELAGIAAAGPVDGFEKFRNWLDQGFAGEMHYLERHGAARRDPQSILTEVRSVVMVGMNYKPLDDDGDALEPGFGRVARYARGADYHDVLRGKLRQLLAEIQKLAPGCRGRAVVDTAPLLERDFARRAGLGWLGKNTMLLNKRLGSYFFLGALLLDLPLEADPSHDTSHCGTCTACLEACPTSAFTAPGILDARRCISYLTIELRGSIAEEFRKPLGDWVFGCDICQEVCPWNRKAPAGKDPSLQSGGDLEGLDCVELLSMSLEQFRARFGGTAFLRPKRAGLLRNAALVLGNQGNAAAIPALEQALEDPEPVVREAAAWALARIEERRCQTTPSA